MEARPLEGQMIPPRGRSKNVLKPRVCSIPEGILPRSKAIRGNTRGQRLQRNFLLAEEPVGMNPFPQSQPLR